jgi:hypothetical protein
MKAARRAVLESMAPSGEIVESSASTIMPLFHWLSSMGPLEAHLNNAAILMQVYNACSDAGYMY